MHSQIDIAKYLSQLKDIEAGELGRLRECIALSAQVLLVLKSKSKMIGEVPTSLGSISKCMPYAFEGVEFTSIEQLISYLGHYFASVTGDKVEVVSMSSVLNSNYNPKYFPFSFFLGMVELRYFSAEEMIKPEETSRFYPYQEV